MKKGSAATWAKVHHQQGFANQSSGTFTVFKSDIEKAFGNANTQQEAMNWLATTCIATGEQLQEYINQFKLNVICAKYDKIKDAVAHAPPTMVFFFLFLFALLFAAFLLTVYIALCKPGCAVSAADTSSV